MADKRYTLGPEAVRQIAEVVRRSGGLTNGVDSRRSRRPVLSTFSGVCDAVTTSAITTASGNTYGKGTVSILIAAETSPGSGVYEYTNNPAFEAGMLVINGYVISTSIPTNTYCTVFFSDGVPLKLLTWTC